MTLSSMLSINNIEVLQTLANDPVFLPELFSRLRDTNIGDKGWDDLVAFLQVCRAYIPMHPIYWFSGFACSEDLNPLTGCWSQHNGAWQC